jgi:cob(I)alamin adenosyltransferase
MADGSRRDKNDIRVHCLGEVDELNAHIGVALSLLEDGAAQKMLFAIQHDLFDIGAELCQPGKQLISENYVSALEKSVDELNAGLPPLKEFILPGGTRAIAAIQLARTVCRRVERRLVDLNHQEPSNPVTCRYINRLSDLLFVLGRWQAHEDGSGEVYWNSKFSRLNRDQ